MQSKPCWANDPRAAASILKRDLTVLQHVTCNILCQTPTEIVSQFAKIWNEPINLHDFRVPTWSYDSFLGWHMPCITKIWSKHPVHMFTHAVLSIPLFLHPQASGSSDLCQSVQILKTLQQSRLANAVHLSAVTRLGKVVCYGLV